MGAQQPRILILSSSTGGGHDMRARSLVAWCERQEAAIDCTRYQALEASSKVYQFGVALYNSIQKHCPALHHLYFNYLEVFHVSAHESLLLGKQRFIDLLETSHQRASTHVMPPASAGAENEDAWLLGAHSVRGGCSVGGELAIPGSAHFVSGH